MEKSKYLFVSVFAIAVLLFTNNAFAGEVKNAESESEAEEDKVAFGLALGTTDVTSSSHDDTAEAENFTIDNRQQKSFFNLSSTDSRRMLHGHHHNKCCQPDYCSECCHPCPKCCEYGRRRK